MPTTVRNQLIDALERTAEPPYMAHADHAARRRVAADYKAVHDALRAIDEWDRGWNARQSAHLGINVSP